MIAREMKTCLFSTCLVQNGMILSQKTRYFILCAYDKGAEQIDAVYYFAGEYTGIESTSGEEVQPILTCLSCVRTNRHTKSKYLVMDSTLQKVCYFSTKKYRPYS